MEGRSSTVAMFALSILLVVVVSSDICHSINFKEDYFNPCNAIEVSTFSRRNTIENIHINFEISKNEIEMDHIVTIDKFQLQPITSFFQHRRIPLVMFIYELQIYHAFLVNVMPKYYKNNKTLYREVVETRCALQDFSFNTLPMKPIKKWFKKQKMSPLLLIYVIQRYFYDQIAYDRGRRVHMATSKQVFHKYKRKIMRLTKNK